MFSQTRNGKKVVVKKDESGRPVMVTTKERSKSHSSSSQRSSHSDYPTPPSSPETSRSTLAPEENLKYTITMERVDAGSMRSCSAYLRILSQTCEKAGYSSSETTQLICSFRTKLDILRSSRDNPRILLISQRMTLLLQSFFLSVDDDNKSAAMYLLRAICSLIQ